MFMYLLFELQPLALVDNTLQDVLNSLYPTWPHSIILLLIIHVY